MQRNARKSEVMSFSGGSQAECFIDLTNWLMEERQKGREPYVTAIDLGLDNEAQTGRDAIVNVYYDV
jgi:hypothetical protein